MFCFNTFFRKIKSTECLPYWLSTEHISSHLYQIIDKYMKKNQNANRKELAKLLQNKKAFNIDVKYTILSD